MTTRATPSGAKNETPHRVGAAVTGFVDAHPKLLIFSVLFLVFLPNLLFQGFYLIDDHEIVQFLTTLESQGIPGYAREFLGIADFDMSFPRFRPVYYALRAVEVFLWRDHVSLWVAARLMIALLFAVAVFKLASKYYSTGFALFFALVSALTVRSGFLELYFRLGPAETYAMLFIALLLYALALEDKTRKWVYISMAVTALVGIKENFYVLIPLQLFGLFYLLKSKRYAAAAISMVLSALSLAAVACLFLKLQATHGVDIYSKATGSSRLLEAMHSLVGSNNGRITIALVVAFVALLARDKLPFKKGLYVNLAVAFVVSILAYNIYFYSGIPEKNCRYAVPFWPIITAMALIVGASVFRLSTEKFASLSTLSKGYVYALSVLLIAPLIAVDMRGGDYQLNITGTQQQAIAQIVDKSKLTNDVVINVAGSFEYEPVASIRRFLAFRHLHNPLYLRVNKAPAHNFEDPAFSDRLLSELRDLEMKGGQGFQAAKDLGPACLEIYFFKDVPALCKERVYVPY